MITLFQFPPHWGIANASVFCMKLETYLKMVKLPYQTKLIRDPRKAPLGKLPFIKDGDMVIADSSIIIDYLQTRYSIELDAHLTQEQKAQALAVQRLIEEHLYWINSYSRWVDDINWPTTCDTFFGEKRSLMTNLIAKIIRKRMRATLRAHGIGRHSTKDVYQMGVNDIQAIQTLMQGPYMFGEQPSTLDAIVYAILANIHVPPVLCPLKQYLNTQPSLIDYCERMRANYFPELPK